MDNMGNMGNMGTMGTWSTRGTMGNMGNGRMLMGDMSQEGQLAQQANAITPMTPSAVMENVSQWAKEAKEMKLDSINKLAEKQAGLFQHCESLMLPMFETGQFADYKLSCEGTTIDVHKVILAARSPKFVEMMIQQPTIAVIQNVDLETLHLLIKFMYTGIVDITEINPNRIIKLLSAAEQFQVEMVKEGLEAALLAALAIQTAVDYLIIGEELELKDLKAVTIKFIGKNGREMREREDFRSKLKDYPHLMMELFEAASGN